MGNEPYIEIHANGGQCVAYMAAPNAESLEIAEHMVRILNADNAQPGEKSQLGKSGS